MIARISLVTICHHTELLHNYWWYTPHRVLHSHNNLFIAGSLYLSIFLTASLLPPLTPSLWQLPLCSLKLWLHFCLVMFVHLFCFLDSTHKWNHTVFVFSWLFINTPKPIHVATSNKFSFFFYGWVIFHFIPHILYPLSYYNFVRWQMGMRFMVVVTV